MNNKITHFVCVMAMILFVGNISAREKQPAFPGAEGFARYITGGRGGKVYHVTNLNDNGEGSLRWAINQSGCRTIVFDVSGTIHLSSSLPIGQGDVTIAGQTAPGDGICVADYPMSVKANNVIVRYMRFRLGNNNVTLDGADGWDGFGAMDQQNIMVDHCSVSWSIDECLSFVGCKNISVQWCLIAQSLKNAGHSKGSHGYGGNWGGSGASYHHNLLMHHDSRVPRLGPRYTTQLDERMDMRNNVMYNWSGNGCYGGEAMNVNIVNNYYKVGPGTKKLSSTKQRRIAAIGIRTTNYVATYSDYAPTLHVWGKYYVDGNVNSAYSDVTNDNWTYGMYNQIDASSNDGLYTQTTKDTIRLSAPIDFYATTTHSAADAYTKVLNYAGASKSRDSFDALMVSDVTNGVASYTGDGNNPGIINTQNDDKPADAVSSWSPWPTLTSADASTDTDGDGMPDSWEKANGLNASDVSDGAVVCTDGYTNLEHYMNSLVADITESELQGGTIAGTTLTDGPSSETSDYDISTLTYSSSSDASTWEFNNGFTITNAQNKGYAAGSNNCIKFSSGIPFTLNIPSGMAVEKLTLTGYDNYTDVESYISELNGNSYTAKDGYVFPNDKSLKSYSFNFARPVTNTLTFTCGAKQTVLKFTLKVVSISTGITSVKNNIFAGNGKKYNLVGQQIDDSYHGIYIKDGKKHFKK